MSWTPFPVEQVASKATNKNPISITKNARSSRLTERLTMTIRLDMFDPPLPPWICPDGKVDVMFGDGQHAGMIRVVPGKRFQFSKFNGISPKKNMLQLRFPLLPHCVYDEQKERPTAVEHDYADDWLEVTLPSWATVLAKAPAPASAAAPPAGKAPFVSAIANEPVHRAWSGKRQA